MSEPVMRKAVVRVRGVDVPVLAGVPARAAGARVRTAAGRAGSTGCLGR
jgi:hypothetical protein